MMSNLVAKPFNSTTQRFVEGQPVSILDDLAPHTFEDLKARGFITSKRDPAPVDEAAPAPSRRGK